MLITITASGWGCVIVIAVLISFCLSLVWVIFCYFQVFGDNDGQFYNLSTKDFRDAYPKFTPIRVSMVNPISTNLHINFCYKCNNISIVLFSVS